VYAVISQRYYFSKRKSALQKAVKNFSIYILSIKQSIHEIFQKTCYRRHDISFFSAQTTQQKYNTPVGKIAKNSLKELHVTNVSYHMVVCYKRVLVLIDKTFHYLLLIRGGRSFRWTISLRTTYKEKLN